MDGRQTLRISTFSRHLNSRACPSSHDISTQWLIKLLNLQSQIIILRVIRSFPCINNRSSILLKCTKSLPFESPRYCGDIMRALRGMQRRGLTLGEYSSRCFRNIPQYLSRWARFAELRFSICAWMLLLCQNTFENLAVLSIKYKLNYKMPADLANNFKLFLIFSRLNRFVLSLFLFRRRSNIPFERLD